MISGIESTAFSGMQGMGRGQQLTEEQATQLQDIISNYDPTTMTKEDHDAMRQEFKDAGIGPSQEVGQALRSAGFGPPPEAGMQGPPPGGMGGPPPPPPEELSEESLSLLDYLETVGSGDINEEAEQALLEAMQAQGTVQPGLVVDELL